MPEEIITARIAQLSPAYQEFILSDFISEVSTTFAEAYSFDERKIEILENAVTLYLLLLLNADDTTTFISRNCDLPPAEAETLFAGIVSTLPEGLEAMVTSQFSKMSVGPAALASEIAETEKAFENLQGIRTMAGDMKDAETHSAPTYQSSQSDLIRPTTPPPPNNGPHWETDK
jgi:hypothetical protein